MESVPSNLWKGKWCNTKSFNFGTKNALFVLFWDESFKKFRAKIKPLKFETKIVLLGIFKLRIGKNDCDMWIWHSQICGNAHNCAKQKKNNFRAKNFFVGYFRLYVWKSIVIFLASSNLSKRKVSYKIKNP